MRSKHREFVLEADVCEYANGRYGLGIIIIEYLPDAERVWGFSAGNSFVSEEEAEARSLLFGKDILEGRVAGCAIGSSLKPPLRPPA